MSLRDRLSGILGQGRPGKPTEDLDARLDELEAQAARAQPGYVGTAYNRAGDMALKGGRTRRAVACFGKAIDAFLNDGQREAARGVAHKILRVRPDAVRTLCTLTWLDVGARHSGVALLHLRDYVAAAKKADQREIAATQIYEMARVTPDGEIVAGAADALEALDLPKSAERIRNWPNGLSPDAIHDSEELATACVRAALRSDEANPDAVT